MKPLLFIILISTTLLIPSAKSNDILNTIEPKINYIHKKLNNSSKYLDEFLSNEYDDAIYTKSYINIENSIGKIEGKSIKVEPNIDIRLYLPKIKEKLSLTINNNENKLNQEYEDSNEKINYNDDSYNIGLSYDSIKKDINLKFKLGLKASSNPYIYIKANANKQFILNNKNSIKLEQKFKYSHLYKLDAHSLYEYLYKIDNNLNFFNYNEYYTNSEIKEDNLYNSLRINQTLNNDKYINYVIALNSNDNNSNFQIKEYKGYISYRSYIRKWLYYDIVPSISWKRSNNFDEELGLIFNLGLKIR